MSSKNLLVIGAGVSGLTTALKLLQAGHKVTIYSKDADGEFPPTSLNAYAFWLPVKADADPRVERWSNETFAEFAKLSGVAGAGITMKKIFELKVTREEPWYGQRLACFRHALPGEITQQYTDAHVLDSAPVIDPVLYLPWLRAQVVAAGGSFVQRELASLADCPSEYEAIINCTALGARQLVGDQDLYPARLQVLKIKHNGFDKVVFDSEGPNKLCCVVPQGDYIKVGAVYEERVESMDVDEEVTKGILQRCAQMIPGFKADRADVLDVTRCLRPKRALTRVEKEQLGDGRWVIHNYGHNGTGYIVSYGVAMEIAGLCASL
jgi:D-amino-acid oxidase